MRSRCFSTPVGPFGHDLRYAPGDAPVNAVIHQSGPPDVQGRAVHRTCARPVDALWKPGVSQPPIANISILRQIVGRLPSAAPNSGRRGRAHDRPRTRGSVASDGPSRRTGPERIAPVDREQARVQLALGRQPGPRAVAAERPGHRRDDPELAAPVDVPPAAGDLAAVARLGRLGAARPPSIGRRSRPRERHRPGASRSSGRRPCTR